MDYDGWTGLNQCCRCKSPIAVSVFEKWVKMCDTCRRPEFMREVYHQHIREYTKLVAQGKDLPFRGV